MADEKKGEEEGGIPYTRDSLLRVILYQLILVVAIVVAVGTICFGWQVVFLGREPAWSWTTAIKWASEINASAISNVDVLATMFLAGVAAGLLPYVSALLSRSDERDVLNLPARMGGLPPNWVRNISFLSGTYLIGLLVSALVAFFGHNTPNSDLGNAVVLGPILLVGIVLCAAGGTIGVPPSGLKRRAEQLEKSRNGIMHLAPPAETKGSPSLSGSFGVSVLVVALSGILIAVILFFPDFSSDVAIGESGVDKGRFGTLAVVEFVYLSAFVLSCLSWRYFYEGDGRLMHWAWILLAIGSMLAAVMFAWAWVPTAERPRKCLIVIAVLAFSWWVRWQARRWGQGASKGLPTRSQPFTRLASLLTRKRIKSLESTIDELRKASARVG